MAEVSTLYIKVDSNGVVVASKNLKGLKTQAASTAGATDKLTDSTKAYNTSSDRTVATLNKASSGFKTVGRDISRYGLLIAGAATATVKFATDLTGGLGQVETLIPATGDRIYELKAAVQDLSISSGKGFSDLTDGLYQTISAFQDSADTVDIFTQATEAAIGGASTVSDSIELASAVTKAYGDTTADATGKVFDLAFETVRLGQTTFPQLANGIQIATDSAVRLGISQEELFATFSALTGVIGDASEVATKFRSASASLLNPNKNLIALFEQLSNQTGETIENGKDFIDVAGGWQEALALIVKTADDSGVPLQKYIKRIEGVTLASRLAGNSADKYAEDLVSAIDATGASKTAYETAKEGIDEYRQSLLEAKQQMIVAAGIIGDTLLPRLVELTQKLADGLTAFSEMDESLQSLILHFGALIVVLGPVLIAVGGILRALQLIKALKIGSAIASIVAVIGTGGLLAIVAAVGAGILYINKRISDNIELVKAQKENIVNAMTVQADYMATLEATARHQIDFNDAGEISAGVLEAMIQKYPDLVQEIGAYETALAEAQATLVNLNREQQALEGRDIFVSDIASASKMEDRLTSASTAVNNYKQDLVELYKKQDLATKQLDAGNSTASGILSQTESQILQTRKLFADAISREQEYTNDLQSVVNTINESASALGIQAYIRENEIAFTALTVSARDFVQVLNDSAGAGNLIPDPEDNLKTWQEWFEEITDVVKETFGNSGQLAGELFNAGLERAFGDEKIYAEALNEAFNPADVIEDQLEATKGIYRELLAIPEAEIDDFFKKTGINAGSTDDAIKELENTVDRLTAAYTRFKQVQIFDDLSTAVGYTNKLADANVGLLTEEERLSAVYDANKTALEDLIQMEGASEYAMAAQAKNVKIAKDALQEYLDEQQRIADTQAAWDSLGDSLKNLGVDAVQSSFYELGVALGNSASDISDFGDAMANVLKSVLDALPALFIQAGLALIAANPMGNLGIGLSLIAAGLAGTVVSGLVQGTIDEGEADETNASGAVYSYAKGGALGSFENSVVNTPTRFGSGAGLMGEAGAEAIMPLTRTSNGDLGVASVGGGDANVKVTIINNTGSEVSQQESTNSDGTKELQITIGKMVSQAISDGTADKSMSSRYGVKSKGRN